MTQDYNPNNPTNENDPAQPQHQDEHTADEAAHAYSAMADELEEHTEERAQPSNEALEIESLKEQLAKTKDQMIRALAEAENTRRRAVKDREDAGKFAISKFSKELIGVADNLRRAMEAIPAEEAAANPTLKTLIEGLDVTERELLNSFAKNGIEKVEPLDMPFNPDFHEVMFEAPIPGKAAGTVIQVIEAGYTLNGRILRPARVGIAKGDQENDGNEPGKTLDTEA